MANYDTITAYWNGTTGNAVRALLNMDKGAGAENRFRDAFNRPGTGIDPDRPVVGLIVWAILNEHLDRFSEEHLKELRQLQQQLTDGARNAA